MSATEGGRATPRGVHELRLVVTVDDHTDAVHFYRDVLGMPDVGAVGSPSGHVVILDAGRATLELVDAAHAEHIDEVEVGRRVAGPIRVALRVEDVEVATTRATAHGADLIGTPRPTPWGSRNARLDGPGGLQLTLFAD